MGLHIWHKFYSHSIQSRGAPTLNCDSDEGSEEGINHGEDQEECGFGGFPLQVSHPDQSHRDYLNI